jgi:hypothetical protein
MKGQRAGARQGMSDNHSGMVALRSIDEHAVGWFRTCSAGGENKPGAIYRCGGSVGVTPNFPFTPAGEPVGYLKRGGY